MIYFSYYKLLFLQKLRRLSRLRYLHLLNFFHLVRRFSRLRYLHLLHLVNRLRLLRLSLSFGLATLTLLAPTPFTSSARAENFATYLALMLNNQPSLRAALYDVYSKGQLYDGNISALFNPTAAIVSSFGKAYTVNSASSNPFLVRDSNYDRNSYSIELKQNIFNGGKDNLAVQQGRAQFHISEWQYLSTEQKMILQSALAYTNVIKARQAYQLQRWNNNLITRVLTAARIRYRAGVITASDLAQSESLKSQNDAMLLTAQADLQSANDEFVRLFGIKPSKELEPIEPALQEIADFIKNRNENSKENWVRDFQKRNPDLQMARLQKTIADIQKRSNLSSFFPTVDFTLSASLTETNQPYSPPTSRSLSGGFTISQPIWFQGQLFSGSRAVIAAAKVADFQFMNTSQVLKQQFNRSYQDYYTASLSQRAYIQAVRSSRLGVKAAEIEYNTGKKTVLDFMEAANNNLINELNLLNAQQNRIIAMLNLQIMTGDLIAGNFGLQSPYRIITEKNRKYRGALDPFAAASEWIFSPDEKTLTDDYPSDFKEKERK